MILPIDSRWGGGSSQGELTEGWACARDPSTKCFAFGPPPHRKSMERIKEKA